MKPFRWMLVLLGLAGLAAAVAPVARALSAQSSNPAYYKAIRTNDIPLLQMTIAAGGLETADERGRTPLMHAAAIGTIESVGTLVAAGAKVNSADSFGMTPLMFGVRDLAKARLFLENNADPNARTKLGQTALLIAASNAGSIEIIRALVAKGADPKITGLAGRTALTLAAGANDLTMVQYFLDRGVDVNSSYTTDKDGYTALMAAATQLNTPMVRLLLAKGADVNKATSNPGVVKNGPLALEGLNALMMAVPYGPPELVRALLDGHANPNARDVRGMTPLMLSVAAENQNPDVVKMLLASGADPAVKSADGETALDWARKYSNPATMALLTGNARQPAATGVAAPQSPTTPAEIRTIVQESTGLLQRTSRQFSIAGGCAGCHHQHFTSVAAIAARAKGVAVDEKMSEEIWQSLTSGLRARANSFAQRLDGPGSMGSTVYTLSALQAGKYPGDEFTDAAVVFLLSRQLTDGRWPREDESRSPIDDGDFNRTALAVAAIHDYAPPSLKEEAAEHLSRARQWMLSARPKTTDDQAMLLFGLRYGGAAEKDVQTAAKGLLALQKSDGGWAPNPYLQSDAYVTGQALWVLSETGVLSVSDPVYRRGVQFLVNTRQKDGSWRVRSRAPKFQPYFESGFPYGHDQWISSAATARAVVALARALP
jgi:ankyrin repeat protein